MNKIYLAYAVFIIVLLLSVFFLPTFHFSETLAVFIATFSIIKFIKNLSIFVLSAIVMLVTIVWPIIVFYWISGNTGVSIVKYISPLSYRGLLNLSEFLLPTCVLIGIFMLVQHKLNNQAN